MNTLSSDTPLIGFALPVQAVARHPDVILSPRALRRWLDELPLANPPKAAQLLVQQLRILVGDPKPGAKFGTLLDLYTPTLRDLFECVQTRTAGDAESATPLDQLDYTMLDILTVLAYGHLRITNDMVAAGKPAPVDRLYHALRLLDEAQTIGWVHYHPPSPENWQLQLQIFRHAEFHQLENETVDFPERPSEHPRTIKQLFFRSLVANLIDPYHRRPCDTLAWHRWAGQHADLLELSVLPSGPFAIPLDVSGNRSALDSARRSKPGTDTRYLSADRFLQTLQDDSNSPQGLYRALTELIDGRKTADQRQDPRQPRKHPYRLWQGLGCIHQRLSALIGGDEARPGPAAPPVTCIQVNQSRSGAAFSVQTLSSTPLTIDEPVLAEAASATPGGPAVGFAGTIQRLRNDDGQVEIGVAKFSGRLIPVTIHGPAAERSRGNPEALLLQHPQNGRLTLLADSRTFREGEIIGAANSTSQFNLKMVRIATMARQTAYIEVENV